MNHVLDACAMLAYLRGEPGAQAVDLLLRDPDEVCLAHSINLCEVFYDFLRQSDEATAEQALQDLAAAGVVERSDLDPAFWRAAGQVKAGGRISLADCFCIALAQRVGGDVVTSDHHEFDAVSARGLCTVTFIR